MQQKFSQVLVKLSMENYHNPQVKLRPSELAQHIVYFILFYKAHTT